MQTERKLILLIKICLQGSLSRMQSYNQLLLCYILNWKVFSSVGRKKLGVVGSQVVFGFPGCFFLGVVAPLYFVRLDRSSSGSSFFLIQNLDWMFLIGQIWL